jgi:formylglycine-generating enzyme required for sulfatase activity
MTWFHPSGYRIRKALFCSLLALMVILISGFVDNTAAVNLSVVSSDGRQIELYKDFHALVIGVGNYDHWPSLPNAVKDAKEVSRLLRRFGFSVTLLIEPTARELKKALDDFVQNFGQEPDRGLLLYYSGNGESQTLPGGTELGWIIPRDCPLLSKDPEGFEKQAVSTKMIAAHADRIRSKHVMMLFDTSIAGDVFLPRQAFLQVITEGTTLPVRQYLIAGSTHEPILPQSVFKQYLVLGLEGQADIIHDGIVTGSELAVYLTDRVARLTGGYQHPQYAITGVAEAARGDFVFKRIDGKQTFARLFVDTHPADSQVRILNIEPRFYQGIEVEPGRYNVEVRASGYEPFRKWIHLKAAEDRTMEVRLSRRPEDLTNSLGMKFVHIKPGSFMMGSPENEPGRMSDETQHPVKLAHRFYIQTTEVTVSQFKRFVEATGYKTKAEKKGGCWITAEGKGWKKKKGTSWRHPSTAKNSGSQNADQLPVTCVTWNDARAFVDWLSRKEKKTYRLPTEAEWEYASRAGNRLPTEAEWEYASRAGTKTPFSSGPCLPTDQANYGGIDNQFRKCKSVFHNNRKRLIPVGSLAPNAWKLNNMHGNVMEWCRDRYGHYPEKFTTDPQGPASGSERVMRGGHWLAEARDCRSARRGHILPDIASDIVGFRLVIIP